MEFRALTTSSKTYRFACVEVMADSWVECDAYLEYSPPPCMLELQWREKSERGSLSSHESLKPMWNVLLMPTVSSAQCSTFIFCFQSQYRLLYYAKAWSPLLEAQISKLTIKQTL